MHLPKLGLENCLNKFSMEARTLRDTLSAGKVRRCWVQRDPDGSKKARDGEGHTWENHRADVAKAHGSVGNNSKGKGDKANAKPRETRRRSSNSNKCLRHCAGCQAVRRVRRDVGGDGRSRHLRAHSGGTGQCLVTTMVDEAANNGDFRQAISMGGTEQAFTTCDIDEAVDTNGNSEDVDNSTIEPAVSLVDIEQRVMIAQEAGRAGDQGIRYPPRRLRLGSGVTSTQRSATVLSRHGESCKPLWSLRHIRQQRHGCMTT